MTRPPQFDASGNTQACRAQLKISYGVELISGNNFPVMWKYSCQIFTFNRFSKDIGSPWVDHLKVLKALTIKMRLLLVQNLSCDKFPFHFKITSYALVSKQRHRAYRNDPLTNSCPSYIHNRLMFSAWTKPAKLRVTLRDKRFERPFIIMVRAL